MVRFLALFIVTLALLSMQAFAATSDNVVNVVVVGVTHGPMQPTISAIKSVTDKYGDRINVTWLDLGTPEGAQYAQEHQLTAHMNILINGNYQFSHNGKNIAFQWFEGQGWTKDDLDAVIADSLANNATVAPSAQSSGFPLPLVAGAIALVILLIGGWFVMSRKKKGKQK